MVVGTNRTVQTSASDSSSVPSPGPTDLPNRSAASSPRLLAFSVSRRTTVFYFAQDSVVAALIIALRAFRGPFLRDVSRESPTRTHPPRKPERQRRAYTYLYAEEKKVPWRGIK